MFIQIALLFMIMIPTTACPRGIGNEGICLDFGPHAINPADSTTKRFFCFGFKYLDHNTSCNSQGESCVINKNTSTKLHNRPYQEKYNK